ncbi:MAG: aminotransferase class I/II-fold pyridoxal phosphate-dependent enzyme [Actinomycetales bacterium]|nr:aminotransferase class I/II-fold pyridoxal phosphate-dependent enzyme [Actinomycetales bacterium]
MAIIDLDAISLADLRERQSAKYQYYDADVIPAWVAEMDFPLAPPVAAALHAAIDRSDTGYRSANGVAEALVDFSARHWDWQVSPGNVVVVPDVLAGLTSTLELLTEPGSAVVLNTPIYPPFFPAIRSVTGRVVVDVPLLEAPDSGFTWDLDALADAFARPDVSAFLLCSPHNPTGSVPSRETLRVVAELAERHDVLVIADEIHAPLTLPGAQHVPYLTVAGPEANAVSLISASKTWNIPGLKCAQVVGTDRTGPRLAKGIPLEVLFGTGHLGVIGGVAAYLEGDEWLAEVLGILNANRRLLVDLLAEHAPLARYAPPEASYLAWIDFRAYDLGEDPAARFLDEARLALSPGPTYGPPGRGFARLNFATSPAILGEIVARIGRVLQ